MDKPIPGLHHVTSICGSPQANLRFYTGVLRQRLVKKTVNFDDPGTYHLYYADRVGSPGTVLTFFPFADAGPGRAGPGMASAVAYAVPPGALDAWMTALAEANVAIDGPHERFGARMIGLSDPDGMRIELIEGDVASVTTVPAGPAPQIGAFHSVTLGLANPERTARLLTDLFGMSMAGSEADGDGERLRFAADGYASVDLVHASASAYGEQGAGTYHHVAFRARTREDQLAWREALLAAGHQVTPVIDRQYFDSIYFREPGGVLFEVATDPPGFTLDEDEAHLGEALKLPPQYESRRSSIERILPPLTAPRADETA
ncbi:ring-cleaving dioxygenase [Acuticoccus sp. M5D2P5]|uniref:ring-cleaving dioxygenase n=1 Tax=Acuticoccus kalidii TaxID=2910977 RepID=UPI001F4886EC|nr:ring-cleaving dioxygenase [Acuticoccus kalidii]MCF3935144.1 ring-cleaving dioxygenase [Acuticoccus kalidii]